MCGDMDISFGLIILSFTALFEFPLLARNLGGVFDNIVRDTRQELQSCNPRLIQAVIRGQNQRAEPLNDRLADIAGFGATDPRDHVLALLGLVVDAEELGVRADYLKSCRTLYIERVTALLQRHRDLKILSRCMTPKKQPDLLSWAPDWSVKGGVPIWDPKHALFKAAGVSSTPTIYIKETTLYLTGVRFDEVKRKGRSWLEDPQSFGRSCWVASWKWRSLLTPAEAHT